MAVLTGKKSLFQPQQGTVVGQTNVLSPLGVPSLSSGVAVYDPETFEASFSGGGILMDVELWIADINNARLTDISDHLVDGEITMNLDNAIKLSAKFVIRDPSDITPYTHFLAPFVRFTYEDGREDVYQQVGLYATKVAPGTYTTTDAVATFEGDDLTSVMATSAYTDTYNIAAAVNYVSGTGGIITGITASGISRYNIPATTATLPVAQSFPPGTTRLAKDNTLLDQLGWYHLGMDLDGRISTPGAPQNLSSMEPWRVLTDADLVAPLDVQPGDAPIANVVIVVNDDGASAPLTATATNSDPSSPTSTVSIGRSIARVETVSGSTTQAALDALAARLLAESRTYYRVAKLTILHDPTALRLHQVVELNLTGEQEQFNGKWWIRTASMGLTPDKPTVIECNQVTDVLNGVAI